MAITYTVNDGPITIPLDFVTYIPSYCATMIVYSLQMADLSLMPLIINYGSSTNTILLDVTNNIDAGLYHL